MGPGITVATQTWYHIFAAIINGQPDYFFDTTFTPSHAPPNTTAWRRVMSFKTNTVSAFWRWTMTATKRLVLWYDSHKEMGGSGALNGVSNPLAFLPGGASGGISPEMLINYNVTNTNTAITADLSSPDGATNFSIWIYAGSGAWAGGQYILRVDAQNRLKGYCSTVPNSDCAGYTVGWYDPAPDL
jgi:hypothetical protein